ncbi:MAG TPA: carboxypeptidase-like regulatory domain-containing protein [Polyangia bacterium]|jgi:protocatechuate 3,4-dioxygenase beta subunit|nr:carboxypeptidase-like regulatory domain-containing protein [Polyangia bacterium]
MEFASARRALPELSCLALTALLLAGGGCRPHRPSSPPEAPAVPTAAATARLEGRVLDGSDHAVPDAHVLAFPIADGGAGRGEPGRATADLDGRFSIDHLTGGTYRVLVEAAGFPAAQTSPVTAPAAALTLRVAGQGRSIFGRVELVGPEGQPAANAEVLLGAEAGGPVRETRTRADGRFAFSGLGEGTYALRAVGGVWVSRTVRGVAASRDGIELSSPLVLLPSDAMITGQLVQDTGAGLGGFEVRAESAALSPGEDPLPVVARTDKTGAFSLGPVATDSYRVTAARPGYVLRRAPTVTFGRSDDLGPELDTAHGEKLPIKLELLRGARVTGQVTDARGAPAVAAHVRCVASTMDDLTVASGPLPLAAEAAALPSGAGRALGSTRGALTDTHGRFTVDDLIPGRYRVEVAQAGSEPLRTDELTLAPGDRRDLGVLALREGFPVTGRVVDESGGPIEGARVTSTGGADDTAAGLYAVTDGSGSFAVALPAGHYRLTANASGHGAARVEVEVRPGSAPAPLELRLPRAEAVLEGLVRDTGGRPLARARLVAWPRAAAVPGAADAPLGSGSADVGGHFRLADLPAGELRIEVQHPDYPRVMLAATPGQFASLTVPFPGGIAGEAHARWGGAAVTRGRIEAAGPDGAKAIVEIQRAGSFRLLRLAPGHWRLTVSAPGFRAADQELEVPPSASLGEPSVRDLRIELEAT